MTGNMFKYFTRYFRLVCIFCNIVSAFDNLMQWYFTGKFLRAKTTNTVIGSQINSHICIVNFINLSKFQTVLCYQCWSVNQHCRMTTCDFLSPKSPIFGHIIWPLCNALTAQKDDCVWFYVPNTIKYTLKYKSVSMQNFHTCFPYKMVAHMDPKYCTIMGWWCIMYMHICCI